MSTKNEDCKVTEFTQKTPCMVSVMEGGEIAASFFEKEETEGLTKDDLTVLLGDFKKAQLYPLEIEAERVESSAMGFISSRFADMLEYDYRVFKDFISGILGNPNNKSGQYFFEGHIINLRRLEVLA